MLLSPRWLRFPISFNGHVAFEPKVSSKQAISSTHREALERGAPGVVVNQAAVS